MEPNRTRSVLSLVLGSMLVLGAWALTEARGPERDDLPAVRPADRLRLLHPTHHNSVTCEAHPGTSCLPWHGERIQLTVAYELDAPGDGYWFLFADSVSYCRDQSGAKLGSANGIGGVLYTFGHEPQLFEPSGTVTSEIRGRILVRDTENPPPLPITCAQIELGVGYFSGLELVNGEIPPLHPEMADLFFRFTFTAETLWEFHAFLPCPSCIGDW